MLSGIIMRKANAEGLKINRIAKLVIWLTLNKVTYDRKAIAQMIADGLTDEEILTVAILRWKHR